MEFIENDSWDGSMDKYSSTSSKVPIIDEEDETDDQHHEGEENIDSSRKKEVSSANWILRNSESS